MIKTNSQDYYEDSSRHGEYQYVTLKEIIDNFIMSRDSDDHHANIPRFKILFQAMRGLRELYYDVLQEVKAIELELSPTLSVTLPPDYVNYTRISWVDDMGRLHPMALDSRMSIAREYLQDNDFELLFDANGEVLQGSGKRGSGNGSSFSQKSCAKYSFCNTFTPNSNLASSFVNGSYKIDKGEGLIQFGSNAMGRLIVLEYISDGLYASCSGSNKEVIKVNKFAETALMDYIYYELIKNRKRVPATEKHRARKEYYNSRKNAKQRINAVRASDMLQVFKGSTKWIK